MSLSRSCQIEGKKKTGTHMPPLPFDLAPETALGSHSCVALSSARATTRIHPNRPSRTGQRSYPVRVLFLVRQRMNFRVLSYLRQQAGPALVWGLEVHLAFSV